MSDKQKYLIASAFGATALGMLGLWAEVPYSGWVLFIGVVGLFNILW